MQHVRVRLAATGTAADIHPMFEVLAGGPFVDRATALQWNFTGDALGILHYIEGDVSALRSRIDEIEAVVGYEIDRIGERACYLYIRDATTASLRELFEPITAGGVIAVPPIEYSADGTVVFSLFGPDNELQTAIEEVPTTVDVSIEMVGGLADIAITPEISLTHRQREVVSTALDLGYYEVPRSGSQADIAAALDCAPSTVAEHLRKAEAAVIRTQLS